MKTPSPATRHLTPEPWYRHPWPWLLMLGPAVVVVAGITTLVIAIATADVLVSDQAAPRPARVQDASP